MAVEMIGGSPLLSHQDETRPAPSGSALITVAFRSALPSRAWLANQGGVRTQ